MKFLNVCFDICYVFCLQTTKEAIESRRQNVEYINSDYGILMEECAEQEVIIPDAIQQQINNLNSDWEIIQQLATELRPVTEEKMEVMSQGELKNVLY